MPSFFFNDTATTEIYTLSLHDALPISKQLIFIDETAATTKMTRLYGRAPQGKRLVDKVPHGHWKTTTFICGLRYDGVTAPFESRCFPDRKSTRLNSSHQIISYAVFFF